MIPRKSTLSLNQRLTLFIAVLAVVATIIAAFVSGHDWFSSSQEMIIASDTPVKNQISNLASVTAPSNQNQINQIVPTSTQLVTLLQPTPTEYLDVRQASDSWTGEYFNNNRLEEPAAYTRQDTSIDFDWQRGTPAPGVSADYFSIRWTRCLDFEERTYTFSARVDDNLRVFVNDILVFEVPFNTTAIHQEPISMAAGIQCLKIEYTEYDGVAFIHFDFK